MSTKTTYEGWKNYDTWNCALWINNDYALYLSARLFMTVYKGAKPYRDWVKTAGLAVNVCGATIRPEQSKSVKAGAMKQKL
ncbi:MAG: hypothetical protein VKL00_12080 [Synechococcales bacterium]|nr:hypothetical protein [Synechococcales bacterium]